MQKIILTLLFIISFTWSFAEPIDSLKNLISKTKDISKRIDLYIELSDNYLLGDKNKDIAIDSAYFLSLISGDKERIALSSFYKGSLYNFYSEYDSANVILSRAIKLFTEQNDTLYLAASWGEKGNSYCYRAIYDECLDCFLKSLQYTEKLNNDKYLGTVLNNIGNVYYYMGKDSQALIYYKKAYKLNKKNSFEYGIALASNNIGSYYLDNKKLDSALFYFKISEKFAKKINYFEQLAETKANMAKLFNEEKNYLKVQEYSLESIRLFKEIGSDYGLTKSYLGYSQLLFEQKKYSLSRNYIDSCYLTAKENNVTEFVKESYLWKFKLDSVAGDFKNALFNYLIYSELKDSLKSQDVEKQIANLQSVYELDKKEKENLLLKEQKLNQENIIQRQKIISIFSAFVILLFIGIIIILIFYYRNQKRNNLKLGLKNEEILQQKEEIITQNDILIEKNNEIEQQTIELKKYKQKTSDSINYAKRIQSSSLPTLTEFEYLFADSMLLYKPKDIISGDFYFHMKLNKNRHVIAVGDCTGHGVPGALMSILNSSILKEILREKPESTAAEILERARELVKLALKQNTNNQLINDGMDIALIVYNLQKNTFNYCGANRDIIYFSNSEMKIIKANKQPVAAYIKERKFEDNFIPVSKGDVFYLFSDGYIDQMGKNYSKFLLKNFKILLSEIHFLNMDEQKIILDKKLKEHQTNHKQTDDIIILAFKI